MAALKVLSFMNFIVIAAVGAVRLDLTSTTWLVHSVNVSTTGVVPGDVYSDLVSVGPGLLWLIRRRDN